MTKTITTVQDRVECATCERRVPTDWAVRLSAGWKCGKCLETGGYDTGFREACRRLGVSLTDVISAARPWRTYTGCDHR